MKRMLFNATHPEETRVGIVDGQKLIDIDIETAGREARKSNIYKGVITRIEPSLEACFVNYGEERHGFLPFKEISRAYFKEGVDVRTATIREAVTEGQELIVQVEKEERGNKGAALTTFISLAGRYLVLMPNNPRAGGVSRRIEGEERQELREAMSKLDVPSGMSTIARTAGIGRTTEELQWDLDYLLKLWEAIVEAASPIYELVTEEDGGRRTTTTSQPVMNGKPLKRLNPAPFLIVEESNLVVRAIRDYFQPEIGEILVDTDEIYEQARQFMAHVMPDMVGRVKRYRDDIPLFTRFQIEQQIETAYSRTVPLPSGGAIVIDHTEALVAIDVNSARATRGADIEETAFRTNCEAADEVARQMRLRDLGGLIVIDFIDMADPKNQRAVEQRLKDAIRYDRARVQTAKISRFGLMELSRQRLRPALSEGNHITCPRCNGVGVIRDTESCAIQVLRILQEEALKEGTGAVKAQVPVDVATFLLNEKRNDIAKLEMRHRVPIILIPNTYLETPHYHIERIRQDDDRLDQHVPSFELAEEIETKVDDPYAQKSKEDAPVRPKQIPVIKNIPQRDPAPKHVEQKASEPKKRESSGRPVQLQIAAPKKSLFARIAEIFFGPKEEKPAKTPVEAKPEDEKSSEGGRRGRGRRGDRRRAPRAERAERTAEKSRAGEAASAEESSEAEKRRTRRTRRTRRAEAPAEVVTTSTPTARSPEETSGTVESAAEAAPEAAPKSEEPRPRRRTRRRRTDAPSAAPAEEAVKTAPVLEGASDEAKTVEAAQAPAEEAQAPAKPESAEAPAEEAAAEAQPSAEPAPDAAAAPAAEGEGETRRRRPRRRRRPSKSREDAPQAAEGKAQAEAAVEASPASSGEAQEVKPESAAEQTADGSDAAAKAAAAAEADAAALAADSEKASELVQEEVRLAQVAWAHTDKLVQIETKRSAVSAAVHDTFAPNFLMGAAAASTVESEAALGAVSSPKAKTAEPAVEAPDAAEPQAAETPSVKNEAPVPEADAPEAEAPVPEADAPEADAPEGEAPAAEASAPTEAEEAQSAPQPAARDAAPHMSSITEGLEASLARAGLVQVHTDPKLVDYHGYAAVKQPGRVCVSSAEADDAEGELVQVHTRPECAKPVIYEAPVYPGRSAAAVVREEEGPLVQVETKKA